MNIDQRSAQQVLTTQERALRAVGRTGPALTLGEWAPAPDRPDPIALLDEQEERRACPTCSPCGTTAWGASAFAFCGAAIIMAADLAPLPRTGLDVQLCGDAHLANFGTLRVARAEPGLRH